MQNFSSYCRVIATAIMCLFMLSTMMSQAKAAENQHAVDTPMLNFTVGEIGIDDNTDDPLLYGIEYRMRPFSSWALIPAVGFNRAENGASFLYTDLRVDFWMNDKWVLTPSFGVGSFDDSEEIQLGHDIEFRSGIEIAYRFHDQYRVGIALFHLSNAGLSEKNPGTESLVLSFSIPLEN